MIRDVHVKKLEIHNDDRGALMEVVRADDPFFEAIAQTTFTIAAGFLWHSFGIVFLQLIKG